MSLPVEKLVELYDYLLRPVPQLVNVGLPVNILDILGTLRLALAVQQIKYNLRMKSSRMGKEGSESTSRSSYGDTALGSIWAMLVIVYGGEFFASSLTAQQPSFLTNPTGFILVAVCHYVTSLAFKFAPNTIPLEPSLNWEIPLSLLDALTRSMLLCTVSPSMILGHKSASVNNSSTALLLTSTIMANAGFFIANTFSMLSPEGWSVTTPPELLPYGWTSLDLLSAPLITSIYATLTRSQTVFSHLHSASLGQSLNGTTFDSFGDKHQSVPIRSPNDGAFDQESARAICAMIMSVLFIGRTWKNYGYQAYKGQQTLKLTSKEKTQ
ncbi:hypothetical protein FRC02_004128 [Tulasnella sp. 418]|nr:hypothetical protein FRC02_004128 [Tulasnella sp. 418]